MENDDPSNAIQDSPYPDGSGAEVSRISEDGHWKGDLGFCQGAANQKLAELATPGSASLALPPPSNPTYGH